MLSKLLSHVFVLVKKKKKEKRNPYSFFYSRLCVMTLKSVPHAITYCTNVRACACACYLSRALCRDEDRWTYWPTLCPQSKKSWSSQVQRFSIVERFYVLSGQATFHWELRLCLVKIDPVAWGCYKTVRGFHIDIFTSVSFNRKMEESSRILLHFSVSPSNPPDSKMCVRMMRNFSRFYKSQTFRKQVSSLVLCVSQCLFMRHLVSF